MLDKLLSCTKYMIIAGWEGPLDTALLDSARSSSRPIDVTN